MRPENDRVPPQATSEFPSDDEATAALRAERWPSSEDQAPTDLELDTARIVIPGAKDELADEIGQVSVEGRPGDPKAGPMLLRAEILLVFGLVALAAVLIGWWIGPAAGIVALALGTIGLVLNPVVGAAAARSSEREPVARRHATDHHRPG